MVYEAESEANGERKMHRLSAKRPTVELLRSQLATMRARSPFRIGKVLELHKLTTITEPMDPAILD